MSAPGLSIITPLKNADKWLQPCIDSVLAQDFKDWEWIFINDHSTDGSVDIVKKAISSDDRIHLYHNPGDGIIPALQKGFQQSNGLFISRMDADDIMPPDRLKLMVSLLKESPDRTIVTGLVKYFSDTLVSDGYLKYEKWINTVAQQNSHWQNIYRECVIASPNWMMRTNELKGLGGFNDLRYPEDYDLVFKWYSNNFRVASVREITLLWREHPLRTSRSSEHYSQQKFFDLKIRHFIELDYKGRQTVLWGTGVKARLTAGLLLRYNVNFHWMDLQPERYPQGINGKTIEHFSQIDKISSPQVLLAVNPEEEERNKMEAYLDDRNIAFWYL